MSTDSTFQKLQQSLIGKQIVFGPKKYGKVVEILVVVTSDNSIFYAVTDTKKKFNAIQLYELFRNAKGKSSQKHYPDGTTFSKYNVGMKAKRIAKAVQMTSPNTIANINGEEINISSHTSSERNTNV